MKSDYLFLRPYISGWAFIALAMVLGYFIAERYLSYAIPMYQSTAKLKLADLNEGVPNSKLYKDFDVFANTQKIQSEIELIKSEAILKRVLPKVPQSTLIYRVGKIKKTELFSDSPISVMKINLDKSDYNKPFQLSILENKSFTLQSPDGRHLSGNLGDTISLGFTRLLISINKNLLKTKSNLKWADKYEINFLSRDQQYAEISKNLEVGSVDKDVPVIRISYKSENPEKAAIIPNKIAEAYIDDYIETKYGAANVTVDFLNGRITELSQKLSSAEGNILDYRNRNNITNLHQETETDLRKISQLKIQQTNLKMNLDAIKDLEKYMENGKGKSLELAPNFEAFTDLLSTEIVKKIKQLQAEKKDLLTLYTPKNEKVKVVDAKIDDLTSYLAESIRNSRKNLQTKYDNLSSDIANDQKVLTPVPEKERVMNILDREFGMYEQSYNFLNQKRIEAEIAREAKVAFHRVISPASINAIPVSPNHLIIKIISVVLGMLTALFLIFLFQKLRARIYRPDTIEANSILPIAAAIPRFKSSNEGENFFVRLLTQWQVRGLFKDKNISCFTGFELDKGLNFVSKHIIQTLSNQGKKILKVEIKPGDGNTDFFDIIEANNKVANLVLWTDILKLKSVEDIKSIILEKSKNYDHTIIVNSPIGANHTLAMMAMADVNFLCVDAWATPAKKIAEIDQITAEYRFSNLHWVLNRTGYRPSMWTKIKSLFKTRSVEPLSQVVPA
ncbi:MAG: hypothetical protein IPO21_11825 [Bacteroidales bacterium]|nr:hypothetical protein [Bacteroidales bacterium]